MRRLSLLAATMAVCVLWASSAAGQTSSPDAVSTPVQQAARRQPSHAARPKIGLRVYGIAEIESMSATKSFQAVLNSGKSTITNLGVGVDVVNVWQHLFVRFAYAHSSNAATRVAVDDSGNAFSLNVPMTIEITPIEVGAGWRFEGRTNKPVTLTPYLGAAFLSQGYKETSAAAEAGDNVDTSDKGETLFAGLEIGIKVIKIGVEGQFRNLPNAVGAGGVSAAYNESNLGGAVLRLTFGVGF